jgi:uncharacterized membrane protein
MKKILFAAFVVFLLAIPATSVFAQTTTCWDTGCPDGQICKGNPPTCQVNAATCNPACGGATPICNQFSDGTYGCISAAQYGGQGVPGTPTTQINAQTLNNSNPNPFQFQPIVPLPLSSGGGTLNAQTPLSTYINSLFQLAITVGVILAVIMIIIDGFKYMTSEAVGNKKDALAGIRSALFGLLIILAATLVLKIINPSITSLSVAWINGGSGGGGTPPQTATLPPAIPAIGQTIQSGPGNYCFTVQGGGNICGSQSDCQNLRTTAFSSYGPSACTNTVQYEWVGQFTAPSSQPGGQPSQQILHGGPFDTQAQCYASARNDVPSGYTLSQPPGYTCSCDKLKSAQSTCTY